MHNGGGMTKSKLEEAFLIAWRVYGNGDTPVREYRFAEEIGRRWRFDFAFIAQKVAIEIDGGQWQQHGGRHNTDMDRIKLNNAACLGWRVLRFSGTMLRDPERCVQMVRWALNDSHTI